MALSQSHTRQRSPQFPADGAVPFVVRYLRSSCRRTGPQQRADFHTTATGDTHRGGNVCKTRPHTGEDRLVQPQTACPLNV